MKKIAIMQPYFMPYIGYFQLINTVDEFVIYDNIQFSKRGWFHRNRILENGKDVYISLPLKKDSDYLDVDQRFLADNFTEQTHKILAKINNNYRKAPYFNDVFALVQSILSFEDKNLFVFLLHTVNTICAYLNITTTITISSTININHNLRGAEKVKAIVNAQNGTIYINPIGGTELYDIQDFKKNGIELRFLKTSDLRYVQFDNDFVPFLSIIDVLMFNDVNTIKNNLLDEYTII